MFVTGVVLAAGASRRLGQAKQLLPFRGGTLLGSTLDMARHCHFDQLLVTLGGAAESVREQIDLSRVDVIDNPEFADGCGGSVATAMDHVDPRADGVVLLLGDQPGVGVASVYALVAAAQHAPIGVCRYRDGLGHPFWFSREMFAELRGLHGDKAVWRVLHSGEYAVTELAVDDDVPIDVDTWFDYERLLAADVPAAHR
ncbi:NTP transferase domain-containing protein [Acidothermaceae bacterium B102]|nr:NTP transferase domain-containing protein [Acidothermaceae bacterium B102]